MLRIFSSYPEENVKSILQPWQLFLLILAGWVNRSQQDAIDYLLTENRVLRQKLGKKRILLNDDQRRRLAVKGKILGRRMLEQLATIVTTEHMPCVAARLVFLPYGETLDTVKDAPTGPRASSRPYQGSHRGPCCSTSVIGA
jgi:hypothetical protein